VEKYLPVSSEAESLRNHDAARFDKAAGRWHARLCREAPLTLDEAQLALSALRAFGGPGRSRSSPSEHYHEGRRRRIEQGTSLYRLSLPTIFRTVLYRADIATVEELAQRTEEELLGVHSPRPEALGGDPGSDAPARLFAQGGGGSSRAHA